MSIEIPSHLTDAELVAAVRGLAGDERDVTARVVAHLAEIDARGLYLPAGYPSLYVYCREALGYSEDAAYNRNVAARVARRFPEVVDMLAEGRLTLTAVKLLAPVLNDGNRARAFAEAAGKSKRDIEMLVAALAPKPDVPSSVRKVGSPGSRNPSTPAAVPERETTVASGGQAPASRQAEAAAAAAPADPAGSASAVGQAAEGHSREGQPTAGRPTAGQPTPPHQRSVVAPLAPERYRVQFTIGAETEKKLRRLQELLKREIPDGDPAVIFDRAVTVLLEKAESRKNGVSHETAGGARGSKQDRAMYPRPRGARSRAGTRRNVPSFPQTGGDVRSATYGVPPPRRAVCARRRAGAGEHRVHCRAHNAYEGRRIFGAYLPKEIKEARAQYDAMRFAVPERQA